MAYVLDRADKIDNRHTVHPIPIGVRHGVVRVIGTSRTRAGHKNICEAFRRTGHVHIERGLALSRPRKQCRQKQKRITHVF